MADPQPGNERIGQPLLEECRGDVRVQDDRGHAVLARREAYRFGKEVVVLLVGRPQVGLRQLGE